MNPNNCHQASLQEFVPLNLKNRLVMAPMTRCQSDDLGRPTQMLADYYMRRAQEGIGLVIVESCAVNNNDALTYNNGCQMSLEIHSEAWRPIVKKIKELGAKVWVQLFHGGRLTVPEICKSKPIAPSPIKPEGDSSFWRPILEGQLVHFQTLTPFLVPKEMSLSDIKRVISEFANACELAISAGFDGIELHGAHGYLIHQFNNKFSNHRKDQYGYNDKFRFSTQLVKACRNRIPNENVLSYRLSAHMIDNYYLSISSMCLDRFIPKLEFCGVDVFHASELQIGEVADRSGNNLAYTIRKYTNKPIIGCGGLKSLNQANETIEKHNCYDLVAFGRSLILHPRIPQTSLDRSFSYEKNFKELT